VTLGVIDDVGVTDGKSLGWVLDGVGVLVGAGVVELVGVNDGDTPKLLLGVTDGVGVTELVTEGVIELVGVGVTDGSGGASQSPSFVHDVLLSTQKLLLAPT
jgi:hypothetical protein